MNIFQSVHIIVKSLSENYKAGRELQDRVSTQQAQILTEARRKTLLKKQLLANSQAAADINAALIIEIAEECLPYIDDVADELKYDCTLTPMAENNRFLLQPNEEEL